jgi:hypothetical protein
MDYKTFKARATKSKEILKKIDKLLTELQKVDPYGDIIENFCEWDKRTRHTRRLIKEINQDLRRKTKPIYLR